MNLQTTLAILAMSGMLSALWPGRLQAQSENPPGAVTLIVRLPAQARLEIEDYLTKQEGAVRRFISPSLKPGKEYVYQLRARWMEGTREVRRSREVTVQAGQVIEVNFHEEDAQALSEKPFQLLEVLPLTLVRGTSGTTAIQIKRNDFWKSVQLTFPKVPPSLQVDMAKIPFWAESAEVLIRVSESAPIGKILVPFEASGGGSKVQGSILVIVKPIPPELKLEVTMAFPLPPGEKKPVNVRITRKGFQGKVQVKFSDPPPGVKISDLTISAEQSKGTAEAFADPKAPGGTTRVLTLAEGGGARAEAFFKIYIVHRPSLVESFLIPGQLAQGETALSARLKEHTRDDVLRFGLGVLRFIRGVERMGQSFYQYGLKSENTNIPFLRLPVPKNPEPKPIRYEDFRRILENFRADLSVAEATLAQVTDDKVKLPIRLGLIHLDLDQDGKAADSFINILKKIFGRDIPFLDQNPEFLVCFDRGDVSWLRAYCHLLMGMLDFFLAFDTEEIFARFANDFFSSPIQPVPGNVGGKRQNANEAGQGLAVLEPQRLGRFRKHLIEVADLNHQTWKHILAETDDDHEWLPNPRQNAVIGLPVRHEMITSWLAAVNGLKDLLEGKTVLQPFWGNREEEGINLKKLLEDPPAWLDFQALIRGRLPEKYMKKGKPAPVEILFQLQSVFNLPTGWAYPAWFN